MNLQSLFNEGFYSFKVRYIDQILVRSLCSYGWWLSLQLTLSHPYSFHLIVVWSGLGKIRGFMLTQFPPGLGSLLGPHREWSASTKRWLVLLTYIAWPFLTWRNVLSQRGCFRSRFTSQVSMIVKLMEPTFPSVAPEEVLIWAIGAHTERVTLHDQSRI